MTPSSKQAPKTALNHKDDLASLCVRRPVLALVLNLLISLAGLGAMLAIEVRELPNIDQSVVSVWGVLPGASPETMDSEVTSIVEGAVARVPGVESIRASSEENNFRLFAEFKPTVDLDTAASDVRESINRVLRQLPENLEQLRVIKAQDDADPIVSIVATSTSLSYEELSLSVEKDIVPQLLSISGVADVALFGVRERVLRVVLDPLRLTSYQLAIADVANALEGAALDIPVGSFRAEDQEILVRANASTLTEEAIRNINILDQVRIGDVAYVSFGPEDTSSLVYWNNQPVIGLSVIRQPQSNTIEISESVHRRLTKLNARLESIELSVTTDRAVYINGAISEVLLSLAYTVAIVVAAIWLFLGSLRMTLLPAAVIPIALVGALAGIWLMGFSINIMTLLAIILGTGLVVDDAIVVLENIQRARGQGLGPRAGAVIGTRQVLFAVIATTAVLVSVFVPISLIPGGTGRLFQEFGIVLAISVIISSFVALSLIPALSVKLIPAGTSPGQLRQRLVHMGQSLQTVYLSALTSVLKLPVLALLIATTSAAGAFLLYDELDRELIPKEDRGVIYVNATGPDGVGLNYMSRQAEQIELVIRETIPSEDMIGLYTIVGRYDPNRVRVMVPLESWEKRGLTQQAILRDLNAPLRDIPGARIRARSPNSLGIWGAGRGIEMALLGANYDELYVQAKMFAEAIDSRLEHVYQANLSYRPTQAQLSIKIDRAKATDLDVNLDDIATTLMTAVDSLDVVDLSINDESVPIILQTDSTEISSPQDIANIYVKNGSGQLIPLSSLVYMSESSVAAELDRHVQRRAIEIGAAMTPGYSIATAAQEIQALADELLPEGVSLIFLREAARLDDTSNDIAWAYAVGLLVVFLVLCAQFEGLVSPLIVMLTVPFGFAAAIFALYLTETSINIFSQIGLVMLIGLMAKNSILLVEFADQQKDQGLNAIEAVMEAARLRLRPIIMTMLSTILGGLPLILSAGPGAEARQAIGWVMFGGLGIAALFTLFLTPVLYATFTRLQTPRAHEAMKLEEELATEDQSPNR